MPVRSSDRETVRQPCVELSADASNPYPFRKLAVAQSKRDIAVAIKVTEASGVLTLLQFTLAFDPVADRIILIHRQSKPL
jgi:hypothetical protein